MRWLLLQHVPFEGPGYLTAWVESRGFVLHRAELWKEAVFPQKDAYDGLFILGGPMNVYEVHQYPWLASEQHFIARAISERKPILGICLGAQLLAAVLGGEVSEMSSPEIGWFPVDLMSTGRDSVLFQDFPDRFTALHWHGDRLSIPLRAIHVARSQACEEQAFVYENHVVGLQFHLELGPTNVAAMIAHCGDDVSCGQYIQSAHALENCVEYVPAAQQLLFGLLDKLAVCSEVPSSPHSAFRRNPRPAATHMFQETNRGANSSRNNGHERIE
jgi:GMP synthase-like glutamine amidotransferase